MSFSISSLSPIIPINRNIPSSPIPSPDPSSNFWISDWMELLLKKIAQNKLGPTVTTRWLYIASAMVYNSYQFVTKNKQPVDFVYWNTLEKGKLSTSLSYLESWLESACHYGFPLLIRTYMKLSLSDQEIDGVSHISNVKVDQASLLQLQSIISSYFASRDNDGWKNTIQFNGVLPNGSNVIYADQSVDQNLNNLPQVNKWTPLSLNGLKRNYLTPEWGTANKGVLDDIEFKELITDTSSLFPSDEEYKKEMDQVFDITNSLTNDQKMIAEFWAGGPSTVTPPGMWFVFMDVVIRSNGLSLEREIKNYLVVSSGLYQAGICAWRLKRDFMQARPVQKLRQYHYGEPIDEKWNSKTLGQYWLPYQELNFVTPPFPDFVSGHSTFSATSAKLFCYLLESDQIVLQNPVSNLDILKYFSPILTKTADFSINNVFIFPKTSKIESTVPTCGVTLGWNTWTEMAMSSGKSRIYGGIHVESSNQAGLYLGKTIGDKVWQMYKNI